MSLPDNINFDRVIADILSDMETVARGWADGRPKDEIALLNRITEQLSRKRRKCDIGVETPMEMEAAIYELHRQGDNQKDRYGSDFAVTIDIPTAGFKKTALFQLKKSTNYKASLTRVQLDDGCVLKNIEERNFVLSVDEDRLGYRIKSVRECLDAIGAGNASKQFNTSEWEFLVAWLLKWFRCEVGKPTKPDDKDPVEPLLESYKIPAPLPLLTGREAFVEDNIPEGVAVARSWLYYTFKPKEPKQ